MNESTPCGQPCSTCPGAAVCPEHQPLGDASPIRWTDAQARFEREALRGVCDTGRYRMPYFVWGQGAPLLFIHGVCDSSRAFLLPIARLASHFRCIAFDLPTGRDDGARLRHIRHADLVADVWALLDHLKEDRCYVFGSSFGSTIALAALHERPAQLPRAILQGGLAYRPLRAGEWLLAQFGRWLPGTVRGLPGRDRLALNKHFATFRDRPVDEWEQFLASTGTTPAAALAYQVLLLHQLDLRPILSLIRQPVLMICGESDPIVGRDCEEVLERGLPNVGRVVLEGCGHVPMYTHPEMLAAVVRQFLTPPPRCV
jgi:pimeloyl-ACP methyl ester carboxylesterase